MQNSLGILLTGQPLLKLTGPESLKIVPGIWAVPNCPGNSDLQQPLTASAVKRPPLVLKLGHTLESFEILMPTLTTL